MHGDMSARFNFQHFNALYESYLTSSTNGKDTPVMVVLSKADMLTDDEKEQAFKFIKDQMRQLFGKGTNRTVGLTAVSLGKNLTNEGGELEGELDIRATAGNLSIPILFSLFNLMARRIEQTIGKISCSESDLRTSQNSLNKELSRNSFVRFFDNNEASIRRQINSHKAVIGKEKELLNRMNSSMSAIKHIFYLAQKYILMEKNNTIMKAQYFIYTRNRKVDYKAILSPSEEFCPKETRKKFLQDIRGLIDIETYDDPLDTPRWLYSCFNGFVLFGLGVMNSNLSDEYNTDFTGRPVRGFFGIVMKYTTESTILPMDINFYRHIYKKEIEPIWEFDNDHLPYPVKDIDIDIQDGINAIHPASAHIDLNYQENKCVILGNVNLKMFLALH